MKTQLNPLNTCVRTRKFAAEFILVVTLAILPCPSPAAVFDSTTIDPATSNNYWPWGDNRNSRYQLWFSQSSLSSYSGILSGVTHFASGDLSNLGTSSYTLNIYASTTTTAIPGLSASNPESNHGANKTLIFSGSLVSTATLLIDVADVFNYDNSGNLLLDYQFSSFSGVGNTYDGPTYQASPFGVSSDFVRVAVHSGEGSSVMQWGAIRTQLEFAAAVPEPTTAALALLGVGVLALPRRQARH